MPDFKIVSDFEPKGDQPQAIQKLVDGTREGQRHQVLLGVTGSGKTFTMANVIAELQKPTLVIAPNKTLAAQLFQEFRSLFPENAVEYFVSYYDYYQPEAYVPTTDTYIEKDASINDLIDQMRHSATHSVLTRRDVIVVASVSCIYGLGSPETYQGMIVLVEDQKEISRDDVLARLVEIQYQRNDYDFHRGTFRVRGRCGGDLSRPMKRTRPFGWSFSATWWIPSPRSTPCGGGSCASSGMSISFREAITSPPRTG